MHAKIGWIVGNKHMNHTNKLCSLGIDIMITSESKCRLLRHSEDLEPNAVPNLRVHAIYLEMNPQMFLRHVHLSILSKCKIIIK